ncbi:hypothetical protein [Celerinatantimonas yamalensis]|uniref:hypothetical protein n=1 Tax=Celerinatantimonas yamalensis TaxID=559956 RepID=UPI0038CC0FE9
MRLPAAVRPPIDNGLPILVQAKKEMRSGNLAWLQYHIPTLAPKQREPLLYVLLSQYYQFQAVIPHSLLPWLQQIAHERPTLMETTQSDGYQITHPRYDYPALARAIIRHWQMQQRRKLYADQLREGQFPWSQIFRADNAKLLAQQQSVVDALGVLDHKQLWRTYRSIEQHHYYFPDNSVLAAIAYHLEDPSLLATLFAHPVDQYSVNAAKAIANHFAPAMAFATLTQALSYPQMRDYALDAIAILAKRYPNALNYLKQLSQKGSLRQQATQVLARHKLIKP